MQKATISTDLDRAVNRFIEQVKRDRNFVSITKNLTYKQFLADRMLIVHSIREGIPYALFSLIKRETPFSEDDWADFLNISKKSLQRYHSSNDFVFKPIHSEKIVELAEVTQLGKEVFGSMETFNLWLNTPSFALGTMKPLELLKDSYGKELVMSELYRIDYGIFA